MAAIYGVDWQYLPGPDSLRRCEVQEIAHKDANRRILRRQCVQDACVALHKDGTWMEICAYHLFDRTFRWQIWH